MKLKATLITILTLVCLQGYSQISFKTEYLGQSSFWLQKKNKEPRERVGEAEGSAVVYSGSINIPLSVKMNEDKKPIAWSAGLSGSYASLNNKNFTEDLVVSEILNLEVGISHRRPIGRRWTLMASAGIGVYAATSDLSKINGKNVLGSASTLFIYQVNPKLEIGGGVAINSTFGYPMAFPALYLNWQTQGKFDFNLRMTNGLSISTGYNVNKFLKLSLIGEMNGQLALLEKDGKDVMFSHLYIVSGLRTDLKLSKRVSIPFTAGINAMRPTSFSDRTLKGLFQSKDNYYFQISPYLSTGINVKF